MDNVILTRQFNLNSGGEVTLSFFRPMPDEDSYRCAYKISWPNREKSFYGVGVDEIQALLLAMQNAHANLLVSPEWKAGQLSWLGDRSIGLGLPLAGSLTPKGFE